MLVTAVTLTLALTVAAPAFAAGERAIKSRVAPSYPELAKRMKISGVVKLEVTVDGEGKVVSVKTIEGNHMLAPAAEEAVKKWRFEPGAGNDVVHVDLNFALAQ